MNIPTNERADAAYRVNLKRMLRKAGFRPNNDAQTDALESMVKALAQHAPGVIAQSMEARYNEAAKEWEAGNNSGDARILAESEAECERIHVAADRVMALFAVTVDYPGLYPSFNFGGYDYHDTLSLMRAVSQTLQPQPA
jgi:hypothetical protein